MPQDGAQLPQDGAQLPQDVTQLPQDGAQLPQDGARYLVPWFPNIAVVFMCFLMFWERSVLLCFDQSATGKMTVVTV